MTDKTIIAVMFLGFLMNSSATYVIVADHYEHIVQLIERLHND